MAWNSNRICWTFQHLHKIHHINKPFHRDSTAGNHKAVHNGIRMFVRFLPLFIQRSLHDHEYDRTVYPDQDTEGNLSTNMVQLFPSQPEPSWIISNDSHWSPDCLIFLVIFLRSTAHFDHIIRSRVVISTRNQRSWSRCNFIRSSIIGQRSLVTRNNFIFVPVDSPEGC